MDLIALIRICKDWSALGWSVQEQAEQLVAEGSTDELNPNAVELIERWLDTVKRAADVALDDELGDQVADLLTAIAD